MINELFTWIQRDAFSTFIHLRLKQNSRHKEYEFEIKINEMRKAPKQTENSERQKKTE